MEWVDETQYTFYIPSPSMPHVTERKILSFAEFEDGWHYGEGESFDASTIQCAIALHREAIRYAFFTTDAFPGLSGQILVTIYANSHYLEFSVETDGTITLSQEIHGEEVSYQEGLSFGDAVQSLRRLRKDIWKESGSSAESSITVDWAGSRALLSRTLEGVAAESPSLIEGVYRNRATAPAITSDDTTEVSRENLLYSGSSLQTYFPAVAA